MELKKKTEFTEQVVPWIAGLVSGWANLAVGHPFDTVKVRLQTQTPGTFSGPADCLKKTVASEGFLGLYKGITPPLIGKGTIHSVLFGTYNRVILALEGPRSEDAQRIEDARRSASIPTCVAAGVVAGLVSVPVVTPIDQVKAYLQVQYKSSATSRFEGPLDCGRQIIRTAGVAGLYRHWLPTAAEMSTMGLFFGGYEWSRRSLQKTLDVSCGTGEKPSWAGPVTSFLAGGFGGSLFWIFAFPFETIKHRLMTQPLEKPVYSSPVHCLRSLVASEGTMALWRGFLPAILRTFPANGATFVTYEAVVQLFSGAHQIR
mmetsp:Transcript_1852/g.3568  ORF Transcript_1852/g.3568 Transcript_1852/m.3568 type:complete len:316 (-) Transcript_1852:173-1120(-)